MNYFILCEDSAAGRCLSISETEHVVSSGQVELAFDEPYSVFTEIAAKVRCAKVFYNGTAIADRAELSLTASKNSIVADGVDASVISGIPAGAQVAIWSEDREDSVLTADGSDLTVSSNEAVNLTVFVKLWPHVTTSIGVEVVEP